jgi:hypothetical protein
VKVDDYNIFTYYQLTFNFEFSAFYGGRTNAVTLHYKIKKNAGGEPMEKIQYTDICSLYPTVNKYGVYPIGHPQIITEQFLPMSAQNRPYQGLIKAKIIPPRQLFHPVLPYRFSGKLYFSLCRTCTEMHSTRTCQHNESERALVGSWVTLEVYKALENDYKV